MSENKHISSQPAVPPEEDILKYLKKEMADADQHNFEKAAGDDEFMHDAMDGLEALNANKAGLLAQQLNSDLKKHLEKKNKRKAKRKYEEQPWVYFAIILILLLVVAAFIVMRQFGK